jgi:type IV pilus assembly protein PilB
MEEKTVIPPDDDIVQMLMQDGIVEKAQVERAHRVKAKLEVPQRLSQVLLSLNYVSETQIHEMMRKHKRDLRLGDFLVEMNLLSEESLKRVLQMQKENKGRLGEILVKEGIVNDKELCRALAEKFDCPIIEPNLKLIDKRLLTLPSQKFLTRYEMIPFCKTDEGMVVILSDPSNQEALAAARDLFQSKIVPAINTRENILQAVDGIENLLAHRVAGEQQSDIIDIVDQLILDAVDLNVSDIHIEPLGKTLRVRFRKDGVLIHKTDIPKNMQEAILSRVKVLSGADIANKRRHQDGKINFDYYGTRVDIRMSSYVSIYGETIVLRLLNQKQSLRNLHELGMAKKTEERYIEEVLEPSSGVVIFTGPTGSGKTTTLYSSLDFINSQSLKIITAEDPVEYVIDGIVQCSVKPEFGLTFEDTLKAMMRQDPDVIVMGEIRDKTTAAVAIQAALTGHKVFSTFHTEDSIGGIIRLIDMDIETFLISSTVLSVVAQRLLRRVCPACKEKHIPSAVDQRRLALDPEDVARFTFYQGRGCTLCGHTGYSGRVGIYEVLVLSEALRNAVLEKKTSYEIRRIGIEHTGLTTMLEDGLVKAARGLTSLDEIRRCVPYSSKPRPMDVIQRLTEGLA